MTFSADGKTSISIGCDRDAVGEDAKIKFWELPVKDEPTIEDLNSLTSE